MGTSSQIKKARRLYKKYLAVVSNPDKQLDAAHALAELHNHMDDRLFTHKQRERVYKVVDRKVQ